MKLGQHAATFYGVVSILLWSTIVGLVRSASENFGAVGGAALIYSLGTAILVVFMGFPKIRAYPKRYLIWGTLFFVSYEMCFVLALGLAKDRQQAIELGMVNYLWPSFTIALAVLFNRQRFTLLLGIGLLLAFAGLIWVISGDQPISVAAIADNISSNPLSYLLAFIGAVLWAFYSNVTKRISGGHNGMVLFFLLTAIGLWILFAFEPNKQFNISWHSITLLLVASLATGGANALWTLAVIRGNVALLGTLSYFTPVISTAFSSILLSTALTLGFWQGVVMVTLGSIICFLATRRPSKVKSAQ
ncbi:aromatic amino acid DMT transporter YddG [Providencia stuartii]|uniref:Threonine/homoserine exporter RhtA n=1 Tax=Providencia stuartii (strain MRSN 2154) TaxID=1157951 RepID=A0A140NGC3_PROSM|nr:MULTISPECIES: aromatic amino acid DMT transporter YddG [Providencia]AFH92165.1 aromatic amino acid exporter [Providencia stuartii MRSN 2154]MDE8747151.1 aromatic amino acid DMT transporter YddG [Providencia thailandensis]MDE8766157.1 aromatic amino acid DMT transporter YddG [Providencia thailandensis]MDE8778395.1 aromatic amino acid DMT transporter YddG [Providencia thailandensis]MDE8782848.1 aromatic amino acid DMT transporter YddG [Providencia thailandensis]